MKQCKKYLKQLYITIPFLLMSLFISILYKNDLISSEYQVYGIIFIIVSTTMVMIPSHKYIKCLQKYNKKL
jgi:hypothetical protein